MGDSGKNMKKRAASISKDWESVLGIVRLSQARCLSDGGPTIKGRHTVEFPTGSCYLGNWDNLGMAGVGSYIMPHNVEFEGNLKDGMFHGEGELIYPNGGRLFGEWENGKALWLKFEFPDGLVYEGENWKYCKMPDRRFHHSIVNGLEPGTRTLKTNTQPTREIAPNCYDTEEGFYNYKTRTLQDPEDLNKTLRVPVQAEREWIQEHCRKAWDENAGYRPDLYEEWGSTYHILKTCQMDTPSSTISPEESVHQLDTIRFDATDEDRNEEEQTEVEDMKEESLLSICEEEEIWVKEPAVIEDLGPADQNIYFSDYEGENFEDYGDYCDFAAIAEINDAGQKNDLEGTPDNTVQSAQDNTDAKE